MKDFFITYQSEFVTAMISFIVALCTTLLTHFLGNFKLRYTERLKITSELSKIKYDGITRIRKEISILAQQEDLCITEGQDLLISENIGDKIYTPACCYSYDELCKISAVLNDLYEEFGHCLRHTSVIYLIYIRNFLMDYTSKCKRAGITNEELRWISVPLYTGILKWYKKFDKELICSMNRPSMKYFAHSGLKYNFLLKIYGLYFKKIEPYKCINEEKSKINQIINHREELLGKIKK